MLRQVLTFAAASSALFGCKAADAVYWLGPDGSIEVSIAAEQSDLCHPDCSTEGSQTSPKMDFFIGHRGDGGLAEGRVGPGAYSAPPPEDGGTGVLQWQVGGVCDNVGDWPKSVAGTVTLTHVPSNAGDRLEGSYEVDPTGGPYGFTAGTFIAHTCP